MKNKFFLTRTANRSLTFLALLAVGLGTGCKNNDPGPQGNLVFYTFMNGKLFDAIEIYVDGKSVGQIKLPHIVRPECDAKTDINVINVRVPAGKHTWSAKQLLKGKEVDEWDERDETVEAGKCEHLRLTE